MGQLCFGAVDGKGLRVVNTGLEDEDTRTCGDGTDEGAAVEQDIDGNEELDDGCTFVCWRCLAELLMIVAAFRRLAEGV